MDFASKLDWSPKAPWDETETQIEPAPVTAEDPVEDFGEVDDIEPAETEQSQAVETADRKEEIVND